MVNEKNSSSDRLKQPHFPASVVWEHHLSVHSLPVCFALLYFCAHFRCCSLSKYQSSSCLFEFLTTIILIVVLGRGCAGSLNMISSHSEIQILSSWSKNSPCSLGAQLWGKSSVICLEWSLCCLVFSCELIHEWLSRWSHSKQGTQKWAGFLLI